MVMVDSHAQTQQDRVQRASASSMSGASSQEESEGGEKTNGPLCEMRPGSEGREAVGEVDGSGAEASSRALVGSSTGSGEGWQ